MTVSTATVRDFTTGEIARLALQLAGVLPAGAEISPADADLAYRLIELELETLQAEGVVLRTTERATLSLTSGTSEYTLPSDTLDLEIGPNDQVGSILPSDNSAETTVLVMSRNEWLDLSAKTPAGYTNPCRCYIERQASVKVVFWPKPTDTGATFRYARIRLLKGADGGSVTMDLTRIWLQYVTYATATQLVFAKSLPLDRAAALRSEANRMKEYCKGSDKQHGRVRFRLAQNGRLW